MSTLKASPHQQSSYGVSILVGLGAAPGDEKHVYGGTVPVKTVARRRVRNKASRRSRRINRQRAA